MNDELIAHARSYLGVPFGHRGRSRDKIDCVGLILLAYADMGIDLGDRDDYGRDPVQDGLREELLARFGDPIPVDDLQPGDIALMRWHQSNGVNLYNHVGFITPYPMGGLALLHAWSGAKCVVEHRLANPWSRRIVEGFRG